MVDGQTGSGGLPEMAGSGERTVDQPSTINPQPDVGEIIRIVDDQIDVDAIMAEIRANLAGRPPLEPDPSGLSYSPAAGAESELEWAIEEAAESARDLQIGDQLQPGAGLFGR